MPVYEIRDETNDLSNYFLTIFTEEVELIEGPYTNHILITDLELSFYTAKKKLIFEFVYNDLKDLVTQLFFYLYHLNNGKDGQKQVIFIFKGCSITIASMYLYITVNKKNHDIIPADNDNKDLVKELLTKIISYYRFYTIEDLSKKVL